MKSLRSLLNLKKNESMAMRGARAALVVEEADKIFIGLFGDGVSEQIITIFYKNGVIGVRAKSSSAALEIKMNEDKILAKIKEKFADLEINKIKLIV